MRELWVVLQREFVVRVRSRSFVLSTILTPIFLLVVSLGPQLVSGMGSHDEFRVALVDNTGMALGPDVATALATTNPDGRFIVGIADAPLASIRDSLNSVLLDNSLDGYVYLPPDVITDGQVQLLSEESVSGSTERQLTAAVSTAVQAQRLRDTGLQPGELASILRPVKMDAARLTASGNEEHSESGLIFGLLVGFFLYFLIIIFGVQVMQSVQEEKTNRIAEVLVSSIRASHLMLGKVLGVGSAALLQVAIWVAFGALLISQRERLGDFGFPTAMPPFLDGATSGMLVSTLFYTLLGFFLYATLFAAVGAAAASPEDAQRFTLPIIMPLIVPMLLAEPIVTAPRGTIAVVLSWIPLTSPLVMPMRIGAGGATLTEIVGTLVFMAVAVAAVGWLAGKIYRIGILSTGKRPTLLDLARWTRMA